MTHIWFIYRLSLPVFGESQITLVVGSVAAVLAVLTTIHRSGYQETRELLVVPGITIITVRIIMSVFCSEQ